jgi:hypothetical protein
MASRSISNLPEAGMSAKGEVRLFQLVVVVGSVVPIAAGLAGVLHGPAMIRAFTTTNADLDSHFSYLSGLLLGIGVAFLFCIASIRDRAQSFRMLGLIVVTGGIARLIAASRLGWPSGAHLFAYFMELVVVPGLLLWHRRIVRLAGSERPA